MVADTGLRRALSNSESAAYPPHRREAASSARQDQDRQDPLRTTRRGRCLYAVQLFAGAIDSDEQKNHATFSGPGPLENTLKRTMMAVSFSSTGIGRYAARPDVAALLLPAASTCFGTVIISIGAIVVALSSFSSCAAFALSFLALAPP